MAQSSDIRVEKKEKIIPDDGIGDEAGASPHLLLPWL
jgi:hypothetical protein